VPPEKLFNRDFVLLWQGQLISQLGNQAFTLGALYWIKVATGSAGLVGLLAMVTAVAGFLAGPLGGTLADRHSRRAIILLTDLLRGAGMLFLALWMFQRGDSPASVVPVLLGVAVLNGAFGAVFAPAITAALPDLVPRHRLAAANSLRQLSAGVAVSVGQGLGGVLYQLLGAPILFLINGATFLVSALSEAFIAFPPHPGEGRGRGGASFLADARAGLRYAWRRPGVPALLATSAGLNFFFMPMFVLLPFYVEGFAGAGAGAYGLLMAAFSAGTLVGSVLAGWLRLDGRRRGVAMLAGLLLTPPSFLALGVVDRLVPAVAALFAAGLFSGLFNVLEITLLQISTPGEVRGRMVSLALAVSRAVSPIGMGLAGFFAELTGEEIPTVYLLCGAATLAVAVAAASRRSFRELLAWTPGEAGPG